MINTYLCSSVTHIFWSSTSKVRTLWDQQYYFVICLRKGRFREVNDWPVVTQLVKGRANEDKRVAAEYPFRRIGRPFEFIEMESAGCLPAFGSSEAAGGLWGWGQGWWKERGVSFCSPRPLGQGVHCPIHMSSWRRLCCLHKGTFLARWGGPSCKRSSHRQLSRCPERGARWRWWRTGTSCLPGSPSGQPGIVQGNCCSKGSEASCEPSLWREAPRVFIYISLIQVSRAPEQETFRTWAPVIYEALRLCQFWVDGHFVGQEGRDWGVEGSSLLQTSPFSRAFWTISEFFENSTNLSIQKFIDAKDKLLLFHRQVASDSFVTPWTVACQAPLSMRFPGQKDWSRLPFSSAEDLPNSGIQPNFPELAGRFFTTEPPGKNQRESASYSFFIP